MTWVQRLKRGNKAQRGETWENGGRVEALIAMLTYGEAGVSSCINKEISGDAAVAH